MDEFVKKAFNDAEQLKKLAEPMLKNNYGKYLLSLAEEK